MLASSNCRVNYSRQPSGSLQEISFSIWGGETVEQAKTRILIAKPGLDGHERGAWVVAYGLRDAGFEVIYTGLRQTPEQIAEAAVQEDVDVVGLSILSGAHLLLTGKVIQRLKERGAADTKVVVGGIIPDKDIPLLREMGVSAVFTAGTSIATIADHISRIASRS